MLLGQRGGDDEGISTLIHRKLRVHKNTGGKENPISRRGLPALELLLHTC